MRTLVACLLLTLSLPVFADAYAELYRAAGWPQQRAHFRDALELAQRQYQGALPPAIYEALITNSNHRFAPQAIDQRAQAALREHLDTPQAALEFYRSPLGRKVVAAEIQATRKDQLSQHSNGLPRMQAESNRQLLIRHLAQTLPASQAGAEVSLALAGVAADSLSQMIPGLISGTQAQGLLEGQRQRLIEQIEADLDNTLLWVYRELSDPELQEYLDFAQSAAGQRYYQAALQALRAGLAVGRSSAELQGTPGV